jgi:hypothetical protein
MNQWTVDTPNPVLTQDAERMLAVGLRHAKRALRAGDLLGAQRALATALRAAELLDAKDVDA